MILNSFDIERETLLDAAKKIASAARTAPKACGEDSIEIKIIGGKKLRELGDFTFRKGVETGANYFMRDGKIIKNCDFIVIMGVEDKPLGLKHCGYCGLKTCGDCYKAGGHCAIKIADLGIALGSAVSMAADMRIDNRILYSVGKSAMEMGLFESSNIFNAYAVGISISGKNIFFDREANQEK